METWAREIDTFRPAMPHNEALLRQAVSSAEATGQSITQELWELLDLKLPFETRPPDLEDKVRWARLAYTPDGKPLKYFGSAVALIDEMGFNAGEVTPKVFAHAISVMRPYDEVYEDCAEEVSLCYHPDIWDSGYFDQDIYLRERFTCTDWYAIDAGWREERHADFDGFWEKVCPEAEYDEAWSFWEEVSTWE